ncbi:MAG: antiviral reverse transcriptase Drt2 [Patescibacteria group bacterium]|jgi:hypothetical protein
MSLPDRASTWKKYVFDHRKEMMCSSHLDFKIKIISTDDSHLNYALNPKKIVRHQFYPFIEFTDVTRRYKKQDDGITRKSENKPRDLCYASHQDSLVYSWYGRLLGDLYQEYITKKPFVSSVIAYRHIPIADDIGRGKSNIHFATEVFNAILEIGECTVLTFDVKKFFPSIDHEQLKKMWCEVLNEYQLPADHYAVFRSLTKYSIIKYNNLLDNFGTDDEKEQERFKGNRICSSRELHAFRHTRIEGRKSIVQNQNSYGIPQGSAMSGLLSNIFMMDFDEAVYAEVERYGGRYWRYSDDIAIVLPANVDPKPIDEFVRAQSTKKKLNVHGPDKSAKIKFSQTTEGIESVEEPLDYLGFSFNGKKVLLRDKTMARFYRRVSNGVRKEVSRAYKYRGRINVKKLQRQFTHLGLRSKSRRNFLSYAKNASGTTGSEEIKKQVSRTMHVLYKKIEKRKARYRRWSQPK